MPLVPDYTQQPGGRVSTTPAGQRLDSGWAESGSALNAPWCEEIRGDVRGWPWAYLLPLPLLSGFTTPTLGGGSDSLPHQTACCRKANAKNSIQTLQFHDSILRWKLFSGIPSQWKAARKMRSSLSLTTHPLIFQHQSAAVCQSNF